MPDAFEAYEGFDISGKGKKMKKKMMKSDDIFAIGSKSK